jgi:hypothetical protein
MPGIQHQDELAVRRYGRPTLPAAEVVGDAVGVVLGEILFRRSDVGTVMPVVDSKYLGPRVPPCTAGISGRPCLRF